jgi:all-trans-retinol dehydrogenase (NAD+)
MALQALIEHVRGLFGSLAGSLLNSPHFTRYRTVSGVLAILGTCYGANQFLNRFVLGGNRSKPWNNDNELVLITGGSSGMGAHMVRKFSEKNVRVLSLDINPPQNALPANTHFFRVDVTSPDAVHETAEKIRREFGHPTVLINNAGIVSGKTILDVSHNHLKRMFDVNILAHYWLVKEFLPAMIKENHGHVVTMASVASFLTISNNVDYSCVKSGLIAFNEGLRQELRHRYNARGVLTR